MSGLVKQKKYDWKDTNLALFGSDTEKQVKKESAETEPAWAGAGQEVSLKIWRIVKFKVTDVDPADYGKFFSGDSYIVLNTYKPNPDSEELAFDVHFWIGKYSTQDEYGTVAYKTVELDTFLDDRAVQHREVQGYESQLFLSYFDAVTIMEGGADSGFRHVTVQEYKPRLLQFSRKGRNVSVFEVPFSQKRLTPGDVFILDSGSRIIQWNGAECNKDEKFQAAMYVQKLESEQKATSEVIEDNGSTNTAIHSILPVDDEEEDDDEADAIPKDTDPSTFELYKASDAAGTLEFTKVKEGGVTIDDFDTNDVFMLNTGRTLFVWVGNGASPTEKQNSLGYAHAHLAKRNQGMMPVTVLKEGFTCADFYAAIAA